MKIVHISDLHFGAHDSSLQASLLNRVRDIQPDPIICTGDLADNPKEHLLNEAYLYLSKLEKLCADNLNATQAPKLIVVPGNHDWRVKGFLWRPSGQAYARVLDAAASDCYLENENVWIFGFDSAQAGAPGGSGLIQDQDIQRFHERYEELKRNYREAFPHAFKIVAVHHHPLPVNWDYTQKDRWLTMNNAGRFLSAVLFRRIDLVLHGHEHLQAQATLSSSLGGNDHEVSVVSLGATLRKDTPTGNWFGVVHVTSLAVDVEFYDSVGDAFRETPQASRFQVRSRGRSARAGFERWAVTSGYRYRALASIAILDKDGDARRSVECEDLIVSHEKCERASRHAVQLPWTSGYVHKLRVESAGMQIGISQPIPPGSRDHSFQAVLEFERPLGESESLSYNYHWYAVNAFARDKREFDYMYPAGAGSDDMEFTHYVVSDPIEALTVVVKFPEGVAAPKVLQLRVARHEERKQARQWSRVLAIERGLRNDHALRYYDSLNVAALRVTRPEQGLSYGIEWSIPPSPSKIQDQHALNIEAIHRLWLNGGITDEQRQQITELMIRLVIGARRLLMRNAAEETWEGNIEASLMFFDGKHQLHLVSGIIHGDGATRSVDYDLKLDFGDGIARRAFKTNEFRIYAPWEGSESDEPDYYLPWPNGPTHIVLVAFPVQPPALTSAPPRAAYGVFSLGSNRGGLSIAARRTGSGTVGTAGHVSDDIESGAV